MRSLFLALVLAACASDTSTPTGGPADVVAGDTPPHTAAPSCSAGPGGGSADIVEPVLKATLSDRWHEAWLASPAVADLDGDGTNEIIVPRGNLVLVWHLDAPDAPVMKLEVEGGRIWTSPIVGDLSAATAGLEVAVAARDKVYMWDAQGNAVAGFPVTWQDEMRSLAAGDIDGDGQLELVAVTTSTLSAGGQRDIIMAWEANGTPVAGFPPNTSGASGCDDRCYITGGYDQNIALGDVDGDGAAELLAGQDNAYLSFHDGTGRAFDANVMFDHPTKFNGIRFLHDLPLAQQGWANDESTANQAHFTNSAPAIADIDGDGTRDLVILGSVQNAAQDDRYRGVGLWVLRPDGSRLPGWEEPFHAPDYLAGLWDYDGTNVVAATNQVSVGDIAADRPGPELVFAGFDGRIHAVGADGQALWATAYTTDAQVLTGGVALADLTADGVPEVVAATYSPDEGKGRLLILDAGGGLRVSLELPKRGAMPVPTVADVDGDGVLEILVSLKDGEDRERQVLVYEVPGSSDNCLLWPTGRGNLLRNGSI